MTRAAVICMPRAVTVANRTPPEVHTEPPHPTVSWVSLRRSSERVGVRGCPLVERAGRYTDHIQDGWTYH